MGGNDGYLKIGFCRDNGRAVSDVFKGLPAPTLVSRVKNSLNDADLVLKCSVWHLIRGGNDERTAQRRARAERIGA